MWLILPDEGQTTADILASEGYLRMTLDLGSRENKGAHEIHLSLPKFDVVNQMDLIEAMKTMGVTDIFDYAISDFTPMTDTPMLYVNQINHAEQFPYRADFNNHVMYAYYAHWKKDYKRKTQAANMDFCTILRGC